jgi:electron transport complex protein RnfG
MAQTPSTLKNMFLSLFIIALVAGLALGSVYYQTKTPMEQASLKSRQEAFRMVVPEFNNNPSSEMTVVKGKYGEEFKVYKIRKDSVLIGYAVESSTKKGFSGEIKVMVGFKPDGTIINYKVLEHKETPGLGSRMEAWFRPDKTSETDNSKHEASFAKWLFGVKPSSGGNRSVIGKNPATTRMSVTKDNGDIDAITAATISSRAFLDAISNAYQSYLSVALDSAVVKP